MTGGLSPERLLAQIEAIRALDARLEGIRLLAGIEVDILADGRLDLPDDVLARLDFVTASIHSGFGQPQAKIMERLTGAMRNPHVRSIGHPTGRLLGRRDPYEVDLETLARVAAETGTYLEINGSPDRLDLDRAGRAPGRGPGRDAGHLQRRPQPGRFRQSALRRSGRRGAVGCAPPTWPTPGPGRPSATTGARRRPTAA